MNFLFATDLGNYFSLFTGTIFIGAIALYIWIKYLNNELPILKTNLIAKKAERGYVRTFMKNARSKAKMWVDLGDSPQPYRIKSWIERKEDTDDPVNEIEYFAYGEIITKDFSDDEIEVDIRNSLKSGSDIIIKLSEKGSLSADKRVIQLQKRQMQQMLDLLDNLQHNISTEIKDPRVQKILGRQIDKAIASSSTMEAWGNDVKGEDDEDNKTQDKKT